MGFLKSMIGGGAKPLATPTADAAVTPKTAGITAEEDARRKRAAALAAGQPGQLTGAGGDMTAAPLARKTLLGM